MSGKVIVVTGAASGIGLETAKLLASKGAKVALADVQEKLLEQAVADIKAAGGEAFGTVLDIRKRDQVEAWIKKTVDTYGQLDGAANIAGVIGKLGVYEIQDTLDDDWDFVMGVNVNGTLNCLRAEIPYMKSGGSIVNAASVTGLVGFVKNAAYCASKHAVIGLTKVAAKELGPKNIRCNSICPGPIDTPMIRQAHNTEGATPHDFGKIVALGRSAHPKEVANLVDWLLSDGASYITGHSHQVDGGWIC